MKNIYWFLGLIAFVIATIVFGSVAIRACVMAVANYGTLAVLIAAPFIWAAGTAVLAGIILLGAMFVGQRMAEAEY